MFDLRQEEGKAQFDLVQIRAEAAGLQALLGLRNHSSWKHYKAYLESLREHVSHDMCHPKEVDAFRIGAQSGKIELLETLLDRDDIVKRNLDKLQEREKTVTAQMEKYRDFELRPTGG